MELLRSKKLTFTIFLRIVNQKIKKSFFFKRRSNRKVLTFKRLKIILKKKKFKKFKKKSVYKGKFFFKRFFLSILLKNRIFLKNYFFLTKKVRQKKITKYLVQNTKDNLNRCTLTKFTLTSILLRSSLVFSLKDSFFLIFSNKITINGEFNKNPNFLIKTGDCINLSINRSFYYYFKILKKLLKRKIALHRYNSWRFFKKITERKVKKFIKRKIPNYLYLFFLFRLNVPKIIEVDYLTLSTCVIYNPYLIEYHTPDETPD
jgi:hypothetical protein